MSNTPYIPVMWKKVGYDNLTEKWVYNVRFHEVWKWVEEQPVHMWKHYDIPMSQQTVDTCGSNYIFTDEMEAWFMLRWS